MAGTAQSEAAAKTGPTELISQQGGWNRAGGWEDQGGSEGWRPVTGGRGGTWHKQLMLDIFPCEPTFPLCFPLCFLGLAPAKELMEVQGDSLEAERFAEG